MTKEELTKILEAVAKAYEENGKKLTTATIVKDIDENGAIEGEILINKLTDEDKH